MEQTVFYVLGICLVVIALALSAIGLRWERFPGSKAAVAVLAGLVACLVAGTAAFAWINAEHEQDEHAAELAAERQEAAQERAQQAQEDLETVDPEAGEPGEAPGGAEAGDETAGVDGAAVFESAGCGGCHALAAAGTTATTGPALDDALAGRSEDEIRESIVDPNAEIAEGFAPNVMPQNYEQQLSPEELDALVQYLAEAAAGGGGQGGGQGGGG